ncbi:MAG: HDOD domain-containing protein [Chloroflexi bacterium]|nr:HDOD domain-containing protein [Chloroflexota bacterium]
MVAFPPLGELARRLADTNPVSDELRAILTIDPFDPDREDALRAILATTKEARTRLRQIGRSLGDAEAVATDTLTSLQQYGYRRVLSAAVISLVVTNLNGPTTTVDAVTFWRRAVCTSFCAQLVTPDRIPEVGLVPATGLLAEIGLLLLDMEYPEYTKQLAEQAGRGGGLHPDLERATLGFAIHELTAVILTHWGMPAAMVTAVLERDRSPLERGALGSALWIGAEAAVILGFGGQLYRSDRELDPRLRRANERFYGSVENLIERVDLVLAGVLFDNA